ncbi:hypothetical protein BX666DRAFT_2024014 [Dichotomocladium elegans]|nr:hypothetical protein BX666DRAFT_2024014 [Dichotomocladium elegans]
MSNLPYPTHDKSNLAPGAYAASVQGYQGEQRLSQAELLEATIQSQHEEQLRQQFERIQHEALQQHAAEMERQRTALIDDWHRVWSNDFAAILEERTAKYRAQIDALNNRIDSLQMLAQAQSPQPTRVSPTLTNQLQTAIHTLSQQSENQSLSQERLLDRIETLTQVNRPGRECAESQTILTSWLCMIVFPLAESCFCIAVVPVLYIIAMDIHFIGALAITYATLPPSRLGQS